MATKYIVSESASLITGLEQNLTMSQEVLNSLKKASAELDSVLNSGQLQGQTYQSANHYFLNVINPLIEKGVQLVNDARSDLKVYQYEDSKAKYFGNIIKSQLEQQRAIKEDTERRAQNLVGMLKGMTVISWGAIAAAEAVIFKMQRDISYINAKLEALQTFEVNTHKLFQESLTALAAFHNEVESLKDVTFTDSSQGSAMLSTRAAVSETKEAEAYTVTLEQMKALGFKEVTDELVQDFNAAMAKYNITSKISVMMFLATCAYESNGGIDLLENGDDDYFKDTPYGKKKRGAGYIQITGADQDAYLNYKQIPANERLPTPAEYIKTNFPLDSAVWFWGQHGKVDSGKETLDHYVDRCVADNSPSEMIFLATQYYVQGFSHADGFNDILSGIRRGSIKENKDEKLTIETLNKYPTAKKEEISERTNNGEASFKIEKKKFERTYTIDKETGKAVTEKTKETTTVVESSDFTLYIIIKTDQGMKAETYRAPGRWNERKASFENAEDVFAEQAEPVKTEQPKATPAQMQPPKAESPKVKEDTSKDSKIDFNIGASKFLYPKF